MNVTPNTVDEYDEYDFENLTDAELFFEVKQLAKTGYADDKPFYEAMVKEMKRRQTL